MGGVARWGEFGYWQIGITIGHMEEATRAEMKKQRPRDNIKETLESILVAFILAFVFRAFVVEAFVIPSGSMASTLMGAHMRLRCAECGYDFTVNYPVGRPQNAEEEASVRIPPTAGIDTAFSMHCPNCGFKVPQDSPDPRQSARNTPVCYGDRILVLKYLYLVQDPRRWDVVVFKSPSERESNYTVNYIKRLVGLPGEQVMVLDGDVYTRTVTAKAGEPGGWTIQAKPRYVQESLWRVVYDNDHYPLHPGNRGWKFPWRQSEGAGWKLVGENGPGRTIAFENTDGRGSLAFDKDANPGTFPLTDWLPYNETKTVYTERDFLPHGDKYGMEAYEQNKVPRWHVSDLKLQFQYERESGDGPLRAALTKLGHTFTAEITPIRTTLNHTRPDGSHEIIGQAPLAGPTRKPMFVEFSNVDYRVALRINDVEVIASTPLQYAPLLERNLPGAEASRDSDDAATEPDVLMPLHRRQNKLALWGASFDQIRNVFPAPRVQISAERQVASLTHLSLWRDIYYTPHYKQNGRFSELTNGRPESPISLSAGGHGREREYFVLGDNSIMSADAREWSNSVDLRETEDLEVEAGRVPDRFMVGKAFFVYWPAGYRPFSVNAPGLVPNFGMMRFIH
jgi:signal peptidase I